jgi:hypothetical protein
VWEWIKAVWLPIWSRLKLLWLCSYPVVFLGAGTWFFLFNDQGGDFIRTLAETFYARSGVSLRNLLFFLGVAAWSAVSWYCARLLLKRPFPSFPVDFERTAVLRKWLPRVLGACAPRRRVRLPAKRRHRRQGRHDSCSTCRRTLRFAAAFVFFGRRREMSSGIGDDRPAGLTSAVAASQLPFDGVDPVGILLLASGRRRLAAMIGAPALLLLAGASIMLTGASCSILRSRGLPGFTLPVLFAAALFSLWNDNHGVRTTPRALHAKEAPRLPPPAHFDDWLKAKRDAGRPDKPHPVFIVAAAGGGIRAAYWAAAVLGKAADDSPGLWDRHLYAISGVSGGSLGAAVHAVQLAERGGAQAGSPRYAERARKMLGEDFLSPVFAYFLFPDLAQRFFPSRSGGRSRTGIGGELGAIGRSGSAQLLPGSSWTCGRRRTGIALRRCSSTRRWWRAVSARSSPISR